MTNFTFHDKLRFYDNYDPLRDFRTHFPGGEILREYYHVKLVLFSFRNVEQTEQAKSDFVFRCSAAITFGG